MPELGRSGTERRDGRFDIDGSSQFSNAGKRALGGEPTATMLANHQSYRGPGVNQLALSLGMQSGRLTVGGHPPDPSKARAMAAEYRPPV